LLEAHRIACRARSHSSGTNRIGTEVLPFCPSGCRDLLGANHTSSLKLCDDPENDPRGPDI
jgi:hypothetical protein